MLENEESHSLECNAEVSSNGENSHVFNDMSNSKAPEIYENIKFFENARSSMKAEDNPAKEKMGFAGKLTFDEQPSQADDTATFKKTNNEQFSNVDSFSFADHNPN